MLAKTELIVSVLLYVTALGFLSLKPRESQGCGMKRSRGAFKTP